MESHEIYHEKQIRELCALHALNNMFQMKGAFTKLELDNICHSLSPDQWINPHKSLLGLGNYDINVMMKALQLKGYEMIWFDKRKDPSCLNLSCICGFILNIPSDYKFGFFTLPIRRKHWIAIREIAGLFYNLDSKLDAPQTIGNANDLLNHLKNELDDEEKQLFLVVIEGSAKNHSWLLEKEIDSNNSSTVNGDTEIIKL